MESKGSLPCSQESPPSPYPIHTHSWRLPSSGIYQWRQQAPPNRHHRHHFAQLNPITFRILFFSDRFYNNGVFFWSKTSCSLVGEPRFFRGTYWYCTQDGDNSFLLNPLAPNDVYISRTAQLTTRRCILNIYSTNILTEYFKHAAHSPFFLSLFKMPFIS